MKRGMSCSEFLGRSLWSAFLNPHLVNCPDQSAVRPTSPPSHTSRSPCWTVYLIILTRWNVHTGKIFDVDAIPLDIGISKIREQMVTRDALRVEHLAETLRIPMAHGSDLPMLWNLPQPLHAGWPEADAGVQAPRDGLVDQCLPIFFQEGDELLLARDVELDLLVGVVEEPHDGGLVLREEARESFGFGASRSRCFALP